MGKTGFIKPDQTKSNRLKPNQRELSLYVQAGKRGWDPVIRRPKPGHSPGKVSMKIPVLAASAERLGDQLLLLLPM
jgi:hypothetical protein